MERCFNLADLFEVVTDAVPDRPALVAGERRLTYCELDERANRLAHHLSARGIRHGDRVGILSYNCAEWKEAEIAAYKLRAVPVNLNYRYLADELFHILADSGCRALVTEELLVDRVPLERLPGLEHILVIGEDYEEAISGTSSIRDFPVRSPDDHYLLYTGGTTGLPKGVLWRVEDIFFAGMGGGTFAGKPIKSVADIAAGAAGQWLRVLVTAPLMHGAGQWLSWLAHSTGSTLMLWTGHTFDADAVLGLAEREQVQIMSLIGDAMGRPAAELLAADPDKYDLSALFAIVSGAAAMSSEVKEGLRATIPSLALVAEALGGSETGSAFQSSEGTRFVPTPGAAVLGDDLRPVGPGGIGVLAKSGNIPLGYWGDEAKTAATFKTDGDGRRWALQGDLARVEDDGTITLLGRGSGVINSGGEKVFPEEVETVLKTHPDVYDAVVIGTPDPRLGQLVTAIVAPPGPTLEELAAHCRARLAGFKVPRALHAVEAIQRTPVGKVDYAWARRVAGTP